MAKTLIQIVDDQDRPVGSATIKEAQTKGLIQQIARVMAEDKAGNILLQKRSANMGLYPGRWDNSAAGHVDAGETYEQAALREIAEEIGIYDFKLQDLGHFYTSFTFEWRRLNQFQKAYKTIIPANTKFTLQSEEVSEVRWFTRQEVRQLIATKPESVTKGLAEVFKRYYS